jgi:hypothetical protein
MQRIVASERQPMARPLRTRRANGAALQPTSDWPTLRSPVCVQQEAMKNTRLALTLAAALTASLPTFVVAQDTGLAADEQILLKQVMTDKRAVYANNLDMTGTESAAFWPVYDEYEAHLKKLDDRFLNLVNDFAAKYDTLGDADATAMLKEKLRIEKERIALKEKYTMKIAKVLPPKKALRYAQLETRIEIMLRRSVYSMIPLAH